MVNVKGEVVGNNSLKRHFTFTRVQVLSQTKKKKVVSLGNVRQDGQESNKKTSTTTLQTTFVTFYAI